MAIMGNEKVIEKYFENARIYDILQNCVLTLLNVFKTFTMDELKNKCNQAVISPKSKQERIGDFLSVKEI